MTHVFNVFSESLPSARIKFEGGDGASGREGGGGCGGGGGGLYLYRTLAHQEQNSYTSSLEIKRDDENNNNADDKNNDKNGLDVSDDDDAKVSDEAFLTMKHCDQGSIHEVEDKDTDTDSASVDSAMFSGIADSEDEVSSSSGEEGKHCDIIPVSSQRQCQFGEFPTNDNSSRTLSKFPHSDCRCTATILDNDVLCGWESKLQAHRYHRPSKVNKGKKPNTPHVYQRLYQEKDRSYQFKHYDDPSFYIQHYRDNYASVGSSKIKESQQDPTTNPDPYLSKLKTNMSAIVDGVNIMLTEAYRVNKIGSGPTGSKQKDIIPGDVKGDIDDEDGEAEEGEEENYDEDDDGEEDGNLQSSVSERAQNLNLSPVRRQNSGSRLKLSRCFIRLPKRQNVVQNQYLNLVVPKTALQRKEIQLDVENGKKIPSGRFDATRHVQYSGRRIASGVLYRQESVGVTRRAQSEISRKPALVQGNRASELRIARSNTFQLSPAPSGFGTPFSNLSLDKKVVFPVYRSMLTSAKSHPSRVQPRKKCCDRIQTIVYGAWQREDARPVANADNELIVMPRPQKVWEGGDRLNDHLRNEKVVALQIPNASCVDRVKSFPSDEKEFSVQYRLQKTRSKGTGTTPMS